MQTREYHTFDKSAWGEGPWSPEPDKIQWQDPASGLPCLIVRNIWSTGALCGYAGVPEGHPDYGKGYDDIDVQAHGGLTFAGSCRPNASEETGICHVPGDGAADHVWWFGFDCAHAGDVTPALHALYGRFPYRRPDFIHEKYRDVAYVKAEVAQLAQSLAQRATDGLAVLCWRPKSSRGVSKDLSVTSRATKNRRVPTSA